MINDEQNDSGGVSQSRAGGSLPPEHVLQAGEGSETMPGAQASNQGSASNGSPDVTVGNQSDALSPSAQAAGISAAEQWRALNRCWGLCWEFAMIFHQMRQGNVSKDDADTVADRLHAALEQLARGDFNV